MKIYETNYIVYSDGRIFSIRYNKFLKPQKRGKNYFFVNLNGKQKYIHRIIAEAYIPNPKNLPQINHINGDKSDNRIDNLEWVSNRENTIHYHKSKFPGVYLLSSGNFSARVRILKKRFYLGVFKTQEEAYNTIISFLDQHKL